MQRSTKIALFRRAVKMLRPLPVEKAFEGLTGFQYDLKTRRGHAPLVVYQMGKVGSRSIHDTLVSAPIPNPVYHIHQLSEEGLRRGEEKCRQQGLWPPSAYLMYGRMLANKRRCPNRVPWKIITMVREPVRTFLSHVFFEPEQFRPFLISNTGRIIQQKVEEYIMDSLAQYDPKRDYISSWFHSEFLPATGVDVYKHEFDTQSGYSIIRGESDDILIMKLESLNKCMTTAIAEFLSLDIPIAPRKSNANESSVHADSYRRICDAYAIPEDVLQRVYASEYAQHFYSASEREKFIEYWANPSTRQH